MARTWLRVLSLAVLAALLAVLSGCSGGVLVVGLGSVDGFDRSPNAVMARFNELAASWGELRDSDDMPGIPPIGSVRADEGDAFSFVPTTSALSGVRAEFENECSRYAISGASDPASGKVNRLSLQIECTSDKVTPDYLTSCDRLMQLALFSLFDALDEKQSRDLSLLFVYDTRPFDTRTVDISLPDKEKSAHCVMDGQLIGLTASVSEGSRVSMDVQFLGAATGAQIGENTENVNCNRKLSQANIESTELHQSVTNLSNEIDQDADWVELQAIADQLYENISVIEELCTLLLQHEKSRTYASRMSVPLSEFKEMNDQLASAILRKDVESIADLQASMEVNANRMQMLIAMMFA